MYSWGACWESQGLDYVISSWQDLNIPNFVFPNVLLTSTYWPSAITSLSFVLFFLAFFLAQFGPPLNMPIGTNRHVWPRANTGWTRKKNEKKKKKKKKKMKKEKKRNKKGTRKEKKKEDKLAFSFRQRKKLKPGFKPCFSQWAPLEYTELETILVETTTYFPLNVFLIFCQYVILYPPTGSLPVHRNRGYLVKSPNYFLAHCFFCLSTKIKICITLIECTNVCTGRFVGFHPPTPWSVRGGPFPCLESIQRQEPMMETPAIQVNNLRTGISLCSSWPMLWIT